MSAYAKEKIIGVKELRTKLPAIARAVGRGERFLVMRHLTPLFRIEPPALAKISHPVEKERPTLAEAFKDLQWSDPKGDKNLSKNIDKIVYGV